MSRAEIEKVCDALADAGYIDDSIATDPAAFRMMVEHVISVMAAQSQTLLRRATPTRCEHNGDYHYRIDQYGEKRPVCHKCGEDLEL